MIKIVVLVFMVTTLPLSAKRAHNIADSLQNTQSQTNLYLSNLEKHRKELSNHREGELDIRRFKEMRLYRSSYHRDMLIKNRDRL